MNKAILMLSIILSATLSACATGTKMAGTDSLRSVFEHYKRVADKSDKTQSKFFTAKMWKEFQQSLDNQESQSGEAIKHIDGFPDELAITGSMESMENGEGCLIVQGTGRDGTPMDYNITFEKPSNRWVISHIAITTYDSGQQRWLTDPVCDPQRKHQLWLKHLQAEANS